MTHNNLVFLNAESAKALDLNKVAGRYDEEAKEIIWLNDYAIGQKFKALESSGVQFELARDNRSNFYIAGMIDGGALAEAKVEDSDMKRIDYNEFMDEYIDDAIDLMFSTESMVHEHRIGLISIDGNRYTLRPELKNMLSDFEVEFVSDELDSGFDISSKELFTPYAVVDNSTVKASELLELTRFIKLEDALDNSVVISKAKHSASERKALTESEIAMSIMKDSEYQFSKSLTISTADLIAGALK